MRKQGIDHRGAVGRLSIRRGERPPVSSSAMHSPMRESEVSLFYAILRRSVVGETWLRRCAPPVQRMRERYGAQLRVGHHLTESALFALFVEHGQQRCFCVLRL